MKQKALAWLTVLLLLSVALPAGALPNPVVPRDDAAQVWSDTGLLLPIPTDAHELSYSVIDGSLAQAAFSYDGVEYTLRQQKTPAPADISGVYEDFPDPEIDEEYPAYSCVRVQNENSIVARWYDAARSASGSLACSSDGAGSFELALYEVFAGLTRGACYAGSASGGTDGFRLDYPILQADDEALTARLNESILQGVQAITNAYAPETRFQQHYASPSFTGKVLTVEWGGTLTAPDAPYEPYIVFALHADCATGTLAPLRSLADTDQLAESTFPNLRDFYIYQYWDDESLNDAQMEYLSALTLDDWKALLLRADFSAEEGWPSAFSSWRDGGYYRDGNEEEFPALVLYVGVPHALQDQITLSIPFSQIDMELTETLQIW